MIQGIRRKFILIAVAVLSAAMIVLTAVINISNRVIVEGELRETLESLSATEDRVSGTLDLEHVLKTGEKRFEPGVLAAANGNILYVDEVNLLDDPSGITDLITTLT